MGGANVGACFRLFDSEPAARPNSFDLVATGEYATGQPEGVEGNVVFGFWREGVVGEMSTADVAAFYASNDVAPAVEPRDADLRAAQAVLGARAKLGLDGDVCVFRPVAYASATACGNTRSRSALQAYFN